MYGIVVFIEDSVLACNTFNCHNKVFKAVVCINFAQFCNSGSLRLVVIVDDCYLFCCGFY